MMIALDVRTACLACGTTYLSMAAAMTYIWRHRRSYPGFGAWTLSAWLGAVGTLLGVWRGLLPDLITVMFANALILGDLILVAAGLTAFTGGRPGFRGYGLLLGTATLLNGVFLYVHPSLRIRLVFVSLAIGALCFKGAHVAWRRLPSVLASANPLIFWMLALTGCFYVLRAVAGLILPPPSEDFMAPSFVQGLSLIVFLITLTSVNIELIALNGQRVERDLRLAVEECKVLRGIIPICASCKRIRDDQGAWNQLEAYIHRHTEAEFTHGICPDCARSLYSKE